MAAICPNNNVLDEELKLVIDMYNSFGECVELEEKDFHGFIALCGSSPAYVFIFIEAMADAAVKLGIPRKKAYRMAAQSVLGSAKMVLDTEQHPGELKDMVCSPSGTTIDAELEEKDFHGFIALCGSSPAYVFIFIEAMADAAVKLGIPRKKAYKMAAQSVLGSAKMILDTEQHPGELKDMVCSPSGTTIDAVVELEKQGFRSSIIEAMIKCADKSKSM